MNKKKLVVLIASIVMICTLAIGGTLAYFQDTDSKTNTFTVGKVDITLEENFKNNSKLFPGKENAVQKEVWIELDENSEDAYVWYEYLIPAALDSTDGSTGTNNVVHVNAYGYTWDTYRENESYWPEGQTNALPLDYTWDHTHTSPEGLNGTETIDGVEYNKYLVLYHGKMSANGGQVKTTPAMSQVYLDAGVDYDAENGYYVDKDGNEIKYDLSENFDIIVNAYAIQAEGFNDVYEAYAAYNAQ